MKAYITVNNKTYHSDEIIYLNGILSVDGIIQPNSSDDTKKHLLSNLKISIYELISGICFTIWMIWVTLSIN